MNQLRFRVKVPVGGAVLGLERIVEIKLRVGQSGHGHGHIAVVEKPHGLVALHVAKDMIVIARNEKQRVLLPFEALLCLSFAGPNGRETAPGQYIDQFVQSKFHGW